MRVTKRRLARELRALMELESDFTLAVDAEAMKLEKQAHTEFEKFHHEWRFLISLHHWSRALEGGWVNLPAYFEGETALPSDRISTMGTTLDLVAARNKFLRCVKESPAPCKVAARHLSRRAFTMAIGAGCCCEIHAPELENWPDPLEDVEKLVRENARR